MFKNWITKTVPFASDEDAEVYKNMRFLSFGEPFGQADYSFIATSRAILGDRVPDCLLIQWMTNEYEETYRIPSCLTIYQTGLVGYRMSIAEGFARLDDLSAYLSRQTSVQIEVYINETEQSSLIRIGALKPEEYMPVFHLLQAFLPRYCPWYFVNKPLTNLEERFLKSLTGKSADEYVRLLREVSEACGDRRKAFLESQIGTLGKVLNEKRIDGIKRTIEHTQDKIEDCQREYSSLIKDLQEQRIFLMGLESQADTSDEMCKELLDYLQHNKHIRIEKVSPDTGWIRFVALGTLSIYDPDVLESMKRNNSLYRFVVPTSFTKRVTDACFGDDAPLAIKVCARYEISLDGEVKVFRGEDYSNYPDYIPNPHIQRHACLGTYQNPIQSALLAGDPIQAIEQCLGSAQSVNLGESEITFYPFMREVFDSKNKIIQMPDGSSVTVDEAYDWLLKREGANV